ncbi:response regulator [Roseateles koreensis]|uniref:Response regulator n=1 Tax=Roseateles koreensis TaxID=2987526 RepID=A0ABT5KPL2_9BURK|nr:response regulator [Roseateles koreensis]MDC8784856.1 response regulator [Roseateles koreensis]
MPFDLPAALGPYLLPLLIAVPLAIVVFVISARRGDDPTARDTVAPSTLQPESVHLLVVDDSAVARAKLGRLFEGAGYPVTLARDGVEALACLAERRFDVLITDLEMPNKDGFELIAAVQGSLETEDLPVIAITGHDEMQARVHQVQGLYGIFKKPWNDRELLKRVETLSSLRRKKKR